jgi:hypothetical protein
LSQPFFIWNDITKHSTLTTDLLICTCILLLLFIINTIPITYSAPSEYRSIKSVESHIVSRFERHPYCYDYFCIGENGHLISLIHNKSASDPAYNQLISFILADNTSDHPYQLGNYTCGDFAETLQNRAEQHGIKAGWVIIYFYGKNAIPHCCNVFNTTDKGVIFIDCTRGKDGVFAHGSWKTISHVKIGENYTQQKIHDSIFTNYNSMDVVRDYKIFF